MSPVKHGQSSRSWLEISIQEEHLLLSRTSELTSYTKLCKGFVRVVLCFCRPLPEQLFWMDKEYGSCTRRRNLFTCVHEWGIFNVLIDALVRKLCMKMLKFIGLIHALQTKLVHTSVVFLARWSLDPSARPLAHWPQWCIDPLGLS